MACGLCFDRIELGVEVGGKAPDWSPYSNWYPVDIDSDGTWELAILSEEQPRRCGVFDPVSANWVWDPVEVPASPYQWGAGDWDGDGFLECVFMAADTVVHFDTRTGLRNPLWVVDVPRRVEWGEPPYVLLVWGETPGGAPAAALLEEQWTEASGCDDCEGLHQTWTWWIHDLFSGELMSSIPGGVGGRHVYQMGESGMTSLVLFETFQEVWGPGWSGQVSRWTQSFRLVDRDWQSVVRADLPSVSEMAGLPVSIWNLAHADFGYSADGGELLVWHTRTGTTFGQVALADYIGAVDLSAEAKAWDLAFNAFWTPYHTPAAYLGMAAFDTDEDGSDELLIALSTGEGWERRDAGTGDFIDTIPGMPIVDLRTGPLFEAGKRELFYLADSGLYFWESGLHTSVGLDPSVGVASGTITLAATPNPFNAAVTFTWSAHQPHSLEVYNIRGQRVLTYDLVGSQSSGTLSWNGADQQGRTLASGVYLARLIGDGEALAVKVVLLK
jgi:hypothetical protein